jgi:hypothetical protein
MDYFQNYEHFSSWIWTIFIFTSYLNFKLSWNLKWDMIPNVIKHGKSKWLSIILGITVAYYKGVLHLASRQPSTKGIKSFRVNPSLSTTVDERYQCRRYALQAKINVIIYLHVRNYVHIPCYNYYGSRVYNNHEARRKTHMHVWNNKR